MAINNINFKANVQENGTDMMGLVEKVVQIPTDVGNLICGCYGNGRFVVLSRTHAIYSKDGGYSWSTAKLPLTALWDRVACGGGKFVAVANLNNSGSAENWAMYSTDGITWQTVNTGVVGEMRWTGITYGQNKFVIIGYDNNARTAGCAYSADGVNWTSVSVPSNSYSNIEYHGGCGKFVAIADSAFGNTNQAIYSSDGITWATTNLGGSTAPNFWWNDIVVAGTRLVAAGGSSVSYSTDGINWTFCQNVVGGEAYRLGYLAPNIISCGSSSAIPKYTELSKIGEKWHEARMQDSVGLPSMVKDFIVGNGTAILLTLYGIFISRSGSFWYTKEKLIRHGGVEYLYTDVDFVPTTLTVNGKALNKNITLSASDVGAIPVGSIVEAPDEIYVGDGDMPEDATIQIIMDGSSEEQALLDELKGYIDTQLQDVAPAYSYGTEDIEAGSASTEAEGTLHFVYE